MFGASQQPSTGQTQTPSLFGGTQQQQPIGSLFGQAAQQQPAGSLFGQPGQQQQPTGSIFAQSTGQQQQQPAGGLFGQSAQQQQPTGLFGQPVQQPQQQPGGLLGQSTQQQPQQQQGAFGSGSIFGGTLGSSTQQQPQQQQTGLFGSTLTTTNPLQAQPTVPAGGFGGSFGGTSIFGNKPQPQPTPGLSTTNQPFGPPLFTKSTKFNDLPDELKRMLESLDSHIQGRVQISKDLHQRKLGDEPLKGQELIRSLHKDFVNVSTTIRNDLHFTNDIKAKVEQAVQDTIVTTRIVDGFKNPQSAGGSGGGYLKDHAGFPLEFFSRVTEQMKERLAWYKSTIEQIERKLTSPSSQAQTPQGISATLQAQHTTFIALASKTAALDTELQKIKTLYTQLWRAKTGSVRDPFNELDRTLEDGGDYGLGSMNV